MQVMMLLVVLAGFAGALFYGWFQLASRSSSGAVIGNYLRNPEVRLEFITEGGVACPGAPFIIPSSGLIALLWNDPGGPYNVMRRHTGIDIFGDGESGTIPVLAAYDGWLTRLDNWRSTVIIRHDDPLEPGRTIWTYYTHLASIDGETTYIHEDFPPGTSEKPVAQGTLLGYQGLFAGAGPPIAMHVHFSIVKSDADGLFLNEAVLTNTLDPSPYLGLNLNNDNQPEFPIRCSDV